MAESAGVDEDLSALINHLWELDVNKCEPGVDYELDLQAKPDVQKAADSTGVPLPIQEVLKPVKVTLPIPQEVPGSVEDTLPVEEVPDPVEAPLLVPLSDNSQPQVIFDLETTGLGYVTSTRNLRTDWADSHLFSWLDEDKVFGKETYSAFRALLDNYESETGLPEQVSEEEIKETEHFIDIIMETPVMQEVHQYLVEKDRAPEDVYEFKCLLWRTWFKLYRRTRGDRDFDSSGFEHVFVGESRGREVTGFHNWIQFYLQEKHGHIDYRGYFRRGTANEDNPRIITLQFIWKKENAAKPIGSSFIGTSPEFEMAIYTLMFLLGREKVMLDLNDFFEVEMTCFSLGRGVGSAFPVSKCD